MATKEATFHDGKKVSANGDVATITMVKETTGSNGLSKYYTFKWSDGTFSCDCRGWTIKKKDKPRDCKHCRTSRDCNCRDMTAVAEFEANAPPVAVAKVEAQRTSSLRFQRLKL